MFSVSYFSKCKSFDCPRGRRYGIPHAVHVANAGNGEVHVFDARLTGPASSSNRTLVHLGAVDFGEEACRLPPLRARSRRRYDTICHLITSTSANASEDHLGGLELSRACCTCSLNLLFSVLYAQCPYY